LYLLFRYIWTGPMHPPGRRGSSSRLPADWSVAANTVTSDQRLVRTEAAADCWTARCALPYCARIFCRKARSVVLSAVFPARLGRQPTGKGRERLTGKASSNLKASWNHESRRSAHSCHKSWHLPGSTGSAGRLTQGAGGDRWIDFWAAAVL